MSSRRWFTAVAVLLPMVVTVTPSSADAAATPATSATSCPDVIDAVEFAGPERLHALNAKVASFGLRTTASAAEQETIDWLEREMLAIPGVTTRSDRYSIDRWQPLPQAEEGPGRSLARAGSLAVSADGRTEEQVPVAGAVPYALPTSAKGKQGELVYLPPEEPITAANARGKVVIRDVAVGSIPIAFFMALSYYLTPDMLASAGENYERPYFGSDTQIVPEFADAAAAGAAGVVLVFDVPRKQAEGYFDPHDGIHFKIPAVFAGVDEGERLKDLATRGYRARIAVRAKADWAPTRNMIATLPGGSAERIVFEANTDGGTWVQENGIAGMVALAEYFAALPIECRPRTMEFAFATGHMHMSKDGTHRYGDELDRDYDNGTVAYVFALEHLGARELAPMPRTDGPGRRLEYTGKGEIHAWFAGESPALFTAAIEATTRRGLDRTAILRGADVPSPGRVPPHCSFGGLGGEFHGRLIPTLAMISNPWSLTMPAFGEGAVDFDRMRNQLLAAGDTALALDNTPREAIAGPYLAYRQARAAGAPTC